VNCEAPTRIVANRDAQIRMFTGVVGDGVSRGLFTARPAVGGFGSRKQLFRGHRDECGFAPDPEALRWWEVLGLLKWAVVCRTQALRHLSGECPSLALLAIGRRIAECEHHLLTVVTTGQATSPRENNAISGPDFAESHHPGDTSVFGQPTAKELAEGVSSLTFRIRTGSRQASPYLNRIAANIVGILDREYRLGAPLRFFT
jgi:hypothetical protein